MRGKVRESLPCLTPRCVLTQYTFHSLQKRTVFYAIASMIAFRVALGRIAFEDFTSSG